MTGVERRSSQEPIFRPLFAEAAATCPVESAIEAIGGRWKLLVLRSLFLDSEQRFKRLLETVPAISAKELTRNLRELEQTGLVVHRTDDGPPELYELSDLGKSLLPLFKEIGSFGERLRTHRMDRRKS